MAKREARKGGTKAVRGAGNGERRDQGKRRNRDRANAELRKIERGLLEAQVILAEVAARADALQARLRSISGHGQPTEDASTPSQPTPGAPNRSGGGPAPQPLAEESAADDKDGRWAASAVNRAGSSAAADPTPDSGSDPSAGSVAAPLPPVAPALPPLASAPPAQAAAPGEQGSRWRGFPF